MPPFFQGFGYAKALVFGEYAVMHGAPALVAALDRRAFARIRKRPPSPQSAFAQKLSEAVFGKGPPFIELKSEAFWSKNGEKIGIGSSAAAVVALTQAMTRRAQQPFPTYQAILQAIALHRSLQGEAGSGADIIAAAMGGLVLVEHCPYAPAITTIPTSLLPPCCLLSTPVSAPTTDYLQAVERVQHTPDYQCIIENMTDICQALAQYLKTAAASLAQRCDATFIELLRASLPLLTALSSVIHKPILTRTFHELNPIAQACDVLLKTSGAGGGDILMVMADDNEKLTRFLKRIPNQSGLTPIPVQIPPSRSASLICA